MGASRASAHRPSASARARADASSARLPPLDDALAKRAPRPVRAVVPQEIFFVDDALPSPTCRAIIEHIERGHGFVRTTSRGPRHGEAWRVNGRFQADDEAFARALWRSARVADAFREHGAEIEDPVGLNPNIRVYRYVEGEHFGAHVDERVTALGRRSQYTMLLYLSEDVVGGHTIFYDARGRERCRVAPKTGRALYFRHGEELPEHEGEAVRGGIKYVLRSDVLF